MRTAASQTYQRESKIGLLSFSCILQQKNKMKKRNGSHKGWVVAKPSTRPYRSSRIFILALGLCISRCSALLGEASEPLSSAAAQFNFAQYEVVTGSAQYQTVLTGLLLGGAIADLALVHIDDNDDRCLRIYAFGDSTWVPKLDARLGSEVLFVDVANIAGRDRLLTYERGRLWSMHSVYEVYFGTPTPDGIVFSAGGTSEHLHILLDIDAASARLSVGV